MSTAIDTDTPDYLFRMLGELPGRFQQNCNGSLIRCSYALEV